MKNFRPVLAPAAALLSLLALAACGGGGDKHPDTSSADATPADGAAPDPTKFCPQVAVLQQAQTVTLFEPGRSDVAGQISTGRITGVSGACTTMTKKRQKLLQVKFTASFLTDNGPANHGQPVSLPWFVAITKGDQIIQKQDYTATLKFDGNMSTTALTSKPIKIVLPQDEQSADVQVLVGFEMTPDQLAYAQAHPSAMP